MARNLQSYINQSDSNGYRSNVGSFLLSRGGLPLSTLLMQILKRLGLQYRSRNAFTPSCQCTEFRIFSPSVRPHVKMAGERGKQRAKTLGAVWNKKRFLSSNCNRRWARCWLSQFLFWIRKKLGEIEGDKTTVEGNACEQRVSHSLRSARSVVLD